MNKKIAQNEATAIIGAVLRDEHNSVSWRTFATRPERVSWMRLRRHLDALPGGALVDVVCDRMNEAAVIFAYAGHRFGIDLGDEGFRFSVEDSMCGQDVLDAVLGYADEMLNPRR